MMLHTSEFKSSNTQTLRELLPNRSKPIFRVHIKHYWHFQWVTPRLKYTLFQTSNSNYIFRELLASNTTQFSWVYMEQYWHFQIVSSKLNSSKNFLRSSYHTFSESYYQTISIYSKLISNSIHTFTELLPNNS